MTDLVVPASFPLADFRAFGLASIRHFPKILSDEDLADPFARRRQFDWAWQAVRYRYRICHECNDEFKAVLANPSEMWTAGWGDEEMNFALDRIIYTFFMSGLSALESFGFCLYFLGGAVHPQDFPHIGNPKKITLEVTAKTFSTSFPGTSLAAVLTALMQSPDFQTLDRFRNVLAHRISGRRSVKGEGTHHADGSYTYTQAETWHIPGAPAELSFDTEMIQRSLDDLTSLLCGITGTARQFAEALP